MISLSLFTPAISQANVSVQEWAEPAKVAEVAAGVGTEANVSWWGFDPEDSTRFLQAALDSGASRIVVPKKPSAWIVEPLFVNRDDLDIVFDPGVILEAKKGSFRGQNDSLLRLWDRKNITLTGYSAILRMHKEDYWEVPYKRAEWRHALDIRGCTGIRILGLTLSDSGGDGIYLGATDTQPYVQDVFIRDVICDGNNRQGISVIGARNLLIEGSVFSNTIGTAPMAGIDLEANNARQPMVNIIIRNCVFLNNSQLGMHVWLSHMTSESEDVSILWENNYVRGGEVGIHVGPIGDDSPKGSIVFRNNIIERTQHAGILVRGVSAKSSLTLEFSGNRLIHTALKEPYDDEPIQFYHRIFNLEDPALWWRPKCPSAPIVLTAQRDKPRVQGNVHFDNDLIIHQVDEPVVVVSGPWSRAAREQGDAFDTRITDTFDDDFTGWANLTGTIRVINPHGGTIDVQTPLKNSTLTVNSLQ